MQVVEKEAAARLVIRGSGDRGKEEADGLPFPVRRESLLVTQVIGSDGQ